MTREEALKNHDAIEANENLSWEEKKNLMIDNYVDLLLSHEEE